jgi:hypothetical protein
MKNEHHGCIKLIKLILQMKIPIAIINYNLIHIFSKLLPSFKR